MNKLFDSLEKRESVLLDELGGLLREVNRVFAELDYESAVRSQAEHDYRRLQEIIEQRDKEGKTKNNT